MQDATQPKFLTVKQAADILHVSEDTIRRWVNEKLINGIHIGRTYRIVQDSLLKSPPEDKNFSDF